MKNESKKFSATTMRNILAFLLVLILVGAAAGFYFGLQIVKAYAIDVSHTVADSNASGTNIEELSVLKQELSERETLVTKANQLFATQDNYQLQSLKDIQKYASEAGITISDTEFDKEAANSASASPGTNGHSVVVTLQNPVSYAKFIQFLDAIEGNLPKMQITGVGITRPTTASGDQIVSDKITITVAAK